MTDKTHFQLSLPSCCNTEFVYCLVYCLSVMLMCIVQRTEINTKTHLSSIVNIMYRETHKYIINKVSISYMSKRKQGLFQLEGIVRII